MNCHRCIYALHMTPTILVHADYSSQRHSLTGSCDEHVSVPCEARTTTVDNYLQNPAMTQEAIRQHVTANVRAVAEPVCVGFMVDKPGNGRSFRRVLLSSLQQTSALCLLLISIIINSRSLCRRRVFKDCNTPSDIGEHWTGKYLYFDFIFYSLQRICLI